MSKEQPPVRNVIPYKSGKRVSTFRKLNVEFGGTALEQALLEQQQQQADANSESHSLSAAPEYESTPHHQSPPLPIAAPLHHSPGGSANSLEYKEINQTDDLSLSDKTSNELTPIHHSPPLSTTPPSVFKNQLAPDKDFNKRANSIERDALPAGTFPGSTKKLYDALYLRTRGAKYPIRMVQASRRDLLNWTGIRNLKTIDNHIRYLMAKGLVIRHWELGSNEGAQYEVALPEEAFRHPSPPLSTTGGEYPPVTTTQKLGIPTTQKLGSGGEGQTIVNKGDSENPKTYKTDDDDDDDDDDDTHTHTLGEFTWIIEQAAREVCGGELNFTDQECARWRELGEVLSSELRTAAQRTESISSAPAFFTAHLKRSFSKRKVRREQKGQESGNAEPVRPVESAAALAKEAEQGSAKSNFSFDDRRRYAQNQQPPLGNGWVVESGTGKYDEVIAAWLAEQNAAKRPSQTVDSSRCPDCHGSGMYYPEGYNKGATKCRHSRLPSGEKPEQAVEQGR